MMKNNDMLPLLICTIVTFLAMWYCKLQDNKIETLQQQVQELQNIKQDYKFDLNTMAREPIMEE